jgi:C4-dicarboxylate transporter DctQ subunit
MVMFLRILDQLEELFISALIAAATLLVFVAVVHRYGLGNAVALHAWAKSHGMTGIAEGALTVFRFLNAINLTWAQELCIYLFVWMAKFGAAYGVRTGIHVGVDVALNMIGEPSKHRIILFGLCCGALFTFIVGTLGANFVWHIAGTEQTSPDLELPIWIVYLAVPLGSYLMCFRFLQVAVVFGQTGGLPHHDQGHVAGVEEADTKSPRAASPALAKEA